MEISNSSGDYLLSLQSALGMAMLNNAMNKNGAVLGRLLEVWKRYRPSPWRCQSIPT